MTTSETTIYFDAEGRASMEQCIKHAADWCVSKKIETLVIFSGTGDGPHYAATKILPTEPYKGLRVVAVTPPYGRPYKLNPNDPDSPLVHSGIKKAMRDDLTALQVDVVSAHLPFKERYDGKERTSEWTRVAESFGVLGGGFALCIQAILVACDAGFVAHGERVVALTADTALEAIACRTESFLAPLEGLLVGHVICRPARYNISKRIHETIAPREPAAAKVVETTAAEIDAPKAHKRLPPAPRAPKRSSKALRGKTTVSKPRKKR
jgi:hypothetical protein